MRRAWVLALAISGCVRTNAVTCGDYVCPAESTCAGAASGAPHCVTPDQVAACAGHEPLDECGQDRRCYDLGDAVACLDAGCGNGFVDPGEQCDDHNNASLDGCAADCLSDETCGNGVVDALYGEQCDDSNHLSHDGCSSSCQNETAAWVAVESDNPLPFDKNAATFDVRRGRFVMTGGTYLSPVLGGGTTANNATWEWDGAVWTAARSPISPMPRDGAAIAYDPDRRVAVLFGGSGDTSLGDTWEWNGSTWRQRDEVGPSARASAGFAYDPRRHVTVMFGGASDTTPDGDPTIWEWNGKAWSGTDGGMTPRQLPRLAYDERRGVMVMAIGSTTAQATELWERTDGPWAKVGEEPARIIALAFDPALGKILAVDSVRTTFTWDGTWTKLPVAPTTFNQSILLASDPVHREVVGLFADSLGLGTNGVVVWNGTGWTSRVTFGSPLPIPGSGAAATNDLLRQRALLFGGSDLAGQTWTFDGTAWAKVADTGPGSRSEHGLAFRAANGDSILFGGFAGAAVLGDTWAWNGASWRAIAATGPSARRGAAMAYDMTRDRVVLFGGSTDTAPRDITPAVCDCTDASTWEWDGTAWANVPSALSPPARRDASMAYDPVRGVIVLFGGQRADTDLSNDLWTYDGTWHEQHPLASPPPRFGATLAWDASRERLVLFGGFTLRTVFIGPVGGSIALEALSDSWELDGTRWRRLVPSTEPSPRGFHVAFTSPVGTGTLAIGGTIRNGADMRSLTETAHAILWSAGDTAETCTSRVDADGDHLAGCADPDCWPSCSPTCPPGSSCPASRAQCGNGTCDPLESPLTCPRDCGPPPASCGDLVCDPSENCAADCP